MPISAGAALPIRVPLPPPSASALSHLGPIPQDVFGALFRSPSLDTRLKLTLNRTRRDAVLTEDFTGAKLLADHPFLADSEQLAQSEASHSPSPSSAPPLHLSFFFCPTRHTATPAPASAHHGTCPFLHPGVLVCFGAPLTAGGHHHVAIISPDGDYVCEHASSNALRHSLLPSDLSPSALITYHNLLASPPAFGRWSRHLRTSQGRCPPTAPPTTSRSGPGPRLSGPRLTSEEVRQQAEAEGLTLLVAANKAG